VGFSRQEYWSGLPFPSFLKEINFIFKVCNNGTVPMNTDFMIAQRKKFTKGNSI